MPTCVWVCMPHTCITALVETVSRFAHGSSLYMGNQSCQDSHLCHLSKPYKKDTDRGHSILRYNRLG